MYLFILESIGTQELILVGLVAIIVFGPRKLPEMARKFGSMMSEFRKVSGDFRSTWENAVNLEETESFKEIESKETEKTIHRNDEKIDNDEQIVVAKNNNGNVTLPEVKKMSKEEFDSIIAEKTKETVDTVKDETSESKVPKAEKTDWL